jgi:hypothetical protein
MENEAKTEQMVADRTDFFIRELASMDDKNERRYAAIARRLTELEDRAHRKLNDDPMDIMGPVVMVMVLLTVAPIIIDLVKQWRLSPSSQS